MITFYEQLMHLDSALRDPLLMQEARKRFDKASLIYDQVHSQSQVFSYFSHLVYFS